MIVRVAGTPAGCSVNKNSDITGIEGDIHESLLSESGVVEPYKDGFSVMPFVQLGEHLISWADVKAEQSLEAGYLPLPRVVWTTDTWSLHIATVSFGAAGASSTAVRYRLRNRGTQTLRGRLILAIRPLQLNPKWQHGGFSRSVPSRPYNTPPASMSASTTTRAFWHQRCQAKPFC